MAYFLLIPFSFSYFTISYQLRIPATAKSTESTKSKSTTTTESKSNSTTESKSKSTKSTTNGNEKRSKPKRIENYF